MRSLIGSLVIAAVTIGVFGGSPSEAQAQFRRPGRATVVYSPNYVPNFNAYPWNYYLAVSPPLQNSLLGYGPYYPGLYGYNPPTLSYYYSLPSYQYSYGPGYAQFYYTPGLSYYWIR
jgi:hypothetical protein